MTAERSLVPARAATFAVVSRVLSMALGLLTLPFLIRYLGGDGFAAWALLLAVAAGCSLFEIGLGLPSTLLRFLNGPRHSRNPQELRRLFGSFWVLLAISMLLGALVVIGIAGPFAHWLGIPASPLFAPHELVYVVFVAVALRAFLQTSTLALIADERFALASGVSMAIPLGSNIAAILAAQQTGRLDLTLLAFWGAQLAVLVVVFVRARALATPMFTRAAFSASRMREIAIYSIANQMDGWAHFINFQFDKFIVAGLVGLWGVAPYEVANRAVAALRSVPASGAETLLPTAIAQGLQGDHAWGWYLTSTRVVAYGVCLFLLAPLAVSPVFLYAWTGEMGYVARGVFVALCLGAVTSVLALPAATMAQAARRPDFQARAALLSIALNVPLSLYLVLNWGLLGAAIGTATAMSASAIRLVGSVHLHFGRPLRETLILLSGFWPLVLVCLCWGGVTWWAFDAWFGTLDRASRFARATRIHPGMVAVLSYGALVTALIAIEFMRGRISREHREAVRRLLLP